VKCFPCDVEMRATNPVEMKAGVFVRFHFCDRCHFMITKLASDQGISSANLEHFNEASKDQRKRAS
jgi:hypothetical protein